MSEQLGFEGKVAIVTGAGAGLGRSHALLLAGRGAKVVVNDLGGGPHGGGGAATAADRVVDEIRAAGGAAVANYDSVEDGAKIVAAALEAFGRVDILINNAGILRDATFHKMTPEDWDLVYRVHLLGTMRVSRAAFPHMREQKFGRIVCTTSAAGLYGNFGQVNYAAAKLGIVGLCNALAIEGRKYNVLVNAIAPVAGSRLTETVLPPGLIEALKPEYVSPLAAWLCHEKCGETGGIFEVGGGYAGSLRWERSEGHTFRLGRPITPEAVAANWSRIVDFGRSTHPRVLVEAMQPVLANVELGPGKGGNEYIDVDQALGYEFPPTTSTYDERDLALYALGIGAAADPLEPKELRLVYEMHGDGFLAFPTYGVIPAVNALLAMAKDGKQAPGFNWGFERLLHGEQYTELARPLPAKATLTHKMRVKDILDKGKNAVVVLETRSFDESGDELIVNELTAVIRGAGGWGGDRGQGGEVNVPPGRPPDATVAEKVAANQALLYRLSGDWNPLHVDPMFAGAFGFPRPILHGLCTFGYAVRHVVGAFAGGDPRLFKSVKVRFAESVFPGETLVTEMWKESDTRVVFRCKVKERDAEVITRAAVELHREIPRPRPARPREAPKTEAPAAEAARAEAAEGSADVFVAIRAFVAKSPELIGQIKTVFQFRLTDPPAVWTINLKDGAGAVDAGETAKPDVTLELTDADFLAMTSGKADPQKLYFSGKLKISGNVMASQKLEFLRRIDREAAKAAIAEARKAAGTAAPAAAPAAAPRAPEGPAIFESLSRRLAAAPGAARGTDAVIRFRVTGPDAEWTVNLRGGAALVERGAAGEPTTVVTLSDEDLSALAHGTESARRLFMTGRMRVDGDVRPATGLDALLRTS